MSDSTTPESGWALMQVTDLHRATHECDYCHNEHVRFVHLLQHPQHQPIRVGCICAGRLTADPETAQLRETEARNRSKRFETWADPDRWTIEEHCHTRDGRHVHWDYSVLIYCTPQQTWRWLIIFSGGKFVSPKAFATPDEAKYDFWTTQLDSQ